MAITIRGKEFECDFFEVDTVERYEAALLAFQDVTADIQRNGRGSASGLYKATIGAIDDFIDTILGEGASAEIFEGAEGNIKVHYDAADELIGYVDKVKKDFNDLANRHAQRNAARAPKPQAQQRPWPPQAKPKHR